MTALAPILQSFFTDKLIRQRQASPPVTGESRCIALKSPPGTS